MAATKALLKYQVKSTKIKCKFTGVIKVHIEAGGDHRFVQNIRVFEINGHVLGGFTRIKQTLSFSIKFDSMGGFINS